MEELVELLTQCGLTISSFESLTCGMFCEKVAGVSHASAILYGGINTYMTSAKVDLLHIPNDKLQKVGVISGECAKMMCEYGQQVTNTDITVSCTGNAGPTAMENKPVGLVYIGVHMREDTEVYECHFQGSRQEIREQVVDKMGELVQEFVKKYIK